jgi:hypothetical protein
MRGGARLGCVVNAMAVHELKFRDAAPATVDALALLCSWQGG